MDALSVAGPVSSAICYRTRVLPLMLCCLYRVVDAVGIGSRSAAVVLYSQGMSIYVAVLLASGSLRYKFACSGLDILQLVLYLLVG